MTFAELKTALADRGFNHLTATQLGEDVNAARALLDDLYLWPYREASATGVAPMYVSDLGVIEAVTNEDSDYALAPTSFQQVTAFGDTAFSGQPELFYVGQGNIVATWPSSGSVTIGVQYWRVTPDLVADIDEPLSPARYHPVIVDLAVQRGYLRTDNVGGAAGLQPFIDRQVQSMANSLLGGQQVSGPADVMSVSGACDA